MKSECFHNFSPCLFGLEKKYPEFNSHYLLIFPHYKNVIQIRLNHKRLQKITVAACASWDNNIVS